MDSRVPLMHDQGSAAARLGTSRDVIRELIARGELSIVELPGGKAWRIPDSELVEWVERNKKVKAECRSAFDGEPTDSDQGGLPRGKSRSSSTGSGDGSKSMGGNHSNTQRLWERRSRKTSRPGSPSQPPDNIVALPSSIS